jgi:hypothetical protein
VDRHGLSALAMTRVRKGGVRDDITICHCEEDGRTTRQSIVFRESERGWRFGGEGQWIATPQEARDDKRELRDGAVRLLRVQWSATGLRPRDDKVGETVF